MEPIVQNIPNNNSQLVRQVFRFVVVGFINTALDFIVLNVLSKITGIGAHDAKIIFLNIVSFSVATTNSYFLNKYWSFGDTSSADRSRQFTIFLGVSVVGALVNTAVLRSSVAFAPNLLSWIAHIITVVLPLSFWSKIDMTLNLAKVLATAVSLVWNFVGYKLLVFRK